MLMREKMASSFSGWPVTQLLDRILLFTLPITSVLKATNEYTIQNPTH